MLQKTEFIWFDGKLVPWDQAQVHVLAHGLHYGTGVFEGIRAYACPDGSSAVFRLPEHSKRLVNSAKILGINMPYTADEISKAIVETVVANKLSEGYIRPLAFAGEGDMGVFPGNNPTHVIIAVWPWGAYLGAEALEKGIRIKTSSFARMHVNTLMSKAKAAGKTPKDMMELAMAGFAPQVLDERTVGYQCDCSEERTKGMLLSLGRRELVKMRDEDPHCEVVCHFCHSRYQYDLNDLIAEYDAQAAQRAAEEAAQNTNA